MFPQACTIRLKPVPTEASTLNHSRPFLTGRTKGCSGNPLLFLAPFCFDDILTFCAEEKNKAKNNYDKSAHATLYSRRFKLTLSFFRSSNSSSIAWLFSTLLSVCLKLRDTTLCHCFAQSSLRSTHDTQPQSNQRRRRRFYFRCVFAVFLSWTLRADSI